MSDLMASTVPTKKQNIPEINLYSLKFIVDKVIRYKYYLLYYKYMKKTVFEKIVEGTLPSNKIYSDKNTYVFLADPARTSGHTLVITKKPYKDILDIPENRAIDLIKTIYRWYKYNTKYKRSGWTRSFSHTLSYNTKTQK